MIISKFLFLCALVLLLVVTVLGAKLNSTSSSSTSTTKKPAADHSSFSTGSLSQESHSAQGNQRNSSSNKHTRDTHSQTAFSGKNTTQTSGSAQRPQGSQVPHSATPSTTHSTNSSAPKRPRDINLQAETKSKSNSTRVARSTNEDFAEVSVSSSSSSSDGHDHEESLKLKSSSEDNSSQHFVPSTHPLFANRQTSNLTDSLRPKLRTPGSASNATGGKPTKPKSTVDSDNDSAEDEDKKSGSSSAEEGGRPKPHLHKVSSSEESISVISSGPVAVQSRNGSHSGVKGIGSGTLRRFGSSTHAPVEEGIDVFLL